MKKIKNGLLISIFALLICVLFKEMCVKEKNIDSSIGYYDDSMNMLCSLDEVKTKLINMYSAGSGNSFYGTATVSVVYDARISAENISQESMNLQWNVSHPNRMIDGTCGLVANTMLFKKYMDVGRLKKDTNTSIFNKLVAYAFAEGYFIPGDANGLTEVEQQFIAIDYLDEYQNGKYYANVDYINLWSTTKKYIEDEFAPVTIRIVESDGSGHRVLVNGCFTLKVNYKLKNSKGKIYSGYTYYNVLRICDGWDNSYINGKWSNARTYKFIFFDCERNLLKLK